MCSAATAASPIFPCSSCVAKQDLDFLQMLQKSEALQPDAGQSCWALTCQLAERLERLDGVVRDVKEL